MKEPSYENNAKNNYNFKFSYGFNISKPCDVIPDSWKDQIEEVPPSIV